MALASVISVAGRIRRQSIARTTRSRQESRNPVPWTSASVAPLRSRPVYRLTFPRRAIFRIFRRAASLSPGHAPMMATKSESFPNWPPVVGSQLVAFHRVQCPLQQRAENRRFHVLPIGTIVISNVLRGKYR